MLGLLGKIMEIMDMHSGSQYLEVLRERYLNGRSKAVDIPPIEARTIPMN
jgi:hypothetical protein